MLYRSPGSCQSNRNLMIPELSTGISLGIEYEYEFTLWLLRIKKSKKEHCHREARGFRAVAISHSRDKGISHFTATGRVLDPIPPQ